MKYLKLFIKQKKIKFAVTLLLLLGQVTGTLLIPYLIAGIMDRGILKGDLNEIIQIGIQMVIVCLLTTLCAVLGSFFSADLAAMAGRSLREQVFRKTQDISIRQFDEIGVSSMITRSASDISNIQQTIGLILQLVVPAPIIMVVSIVMTAKTNGVLALVLVFFVLVFAAGAAIVLKKSNALSQQIQVKLDRINQVVREAVTGVRVIRAFGNEKYEEERSGKAFEDYADNMIRINKRFAVLNPIVWMIMGLSMCAILWIGGYFTVQGQMNVGEISAITEYAIMTLSYLIMAVSIIVMLPKMRSCLVRIEEILDIEPQIADTQTPTAAAPQNTPAVVFDQVTFYYPGAEEPVIRDLSFSCYPGQTTAIIGGTGAGKSTIANLLLRLYDADTGKISLNGTDIRSLSQKELRSAIGYVPQKAFLFSGTIRSNLLMGRKTAQQSELEEALKIAQASAFVDSLDAPVSQGGTNFSGGQKQRLSIARALVKNAQIYIFDDSFSALDLKTDAALRKALRHSCRNAVKIVIAQRISTIMDADQILVIDEGQIVGKGKHEDLIRECPAYYAIAKSQMSEKEVFTHGQG